MLKKGASPIEVNNNNECPMDYASDNLIDVLGLH